MRVTITCEKCGREVYVSTVETPNTFLHIDSPGLFTCPVCTEPTYGPLTVEMMESALAVASGFSENCGWSRSRAARGQARFVLRLLAALDALTPVEGGIDWLLKLARDK